MEDLKYGRGNVATIDLTLSSSPEPEPPHQVTPRQSQVSTYFKREPRPYSTPYVKREKEPQRISLQHNGKMHQSVHQSNHKRTGNIAQMVNASDPAILKKVVLELCQMSPALRGAIARGLATHSRTPHARRREMDFMQKPSGPNMNAYDSSRPFDLVKQNPAINNKMNLDGPPLFRGSQTQPRNPSRINQVPGISQSVPRVKHEFPFASSGPGSDEDELRVPGAFPRSSQQADLASSFQDAQHSPFTSKPAIKPISLSERLAIIKQENSRTPKRCSQCRELFINEDDMCMYHPGSRISRDDGEIVWSCCKASAEEEFGCEFGKHIDPEKRFKQPSISLPN